MKKVLALVLVLCMVFALCACGASNSKKLTMGTGGEAGTYYAFGGVLGSYIGQKTDLSINVVAYNGTNSFAEKGKMDGFRVLGGLYAETVQIVTCNPDIKSVADLKGKNVCVGDVGSGTFFNTQDILAAYDMSLDDISPVYQSFGDSADSLKDGKIDAAVITAGAPTTAVVDLATAKSVYLVSIDDDHMAKLLAACPWYAAYTIPAGTYSGFDSDAVTVTVKATLVCRADLPDDVAYTIVSTIYNNAADITALHAKGAELSLEFATDGIAVPFAAGAAKFFAENGITVATAP